MTKMPLQQMLKTLEQEAEIIQNGLYTSLEKIQSMKLQLETINETLNTIPDLQSKPKDCCISPKILSLLEKKEPFDVRDRAYINYFFNHLSNLNDADARAIITLSIRCSVGDKQ